MKDWIEYLFVPDENYQPGIIECIALAVFLTILGTTIP